MDNQSLENYIKQHREEFDDAFPSMKVWANIERKLNERPEQQPKKPNALFAIGKYAAAIVFLLFLGSIMGSYFTQQRYQQHSLDLSDVSPEYGEVVRYYETEIANGLSQLTSLQHHDPAIQDDLKQLEIVYDELKKELSQNPNSSKEQIINAMIQNYRTRLAILEKVLLYVKENNSSKFSKNNQHGKNI